MRTDGRRLLREAQGEPPHLRGLTGARESEEGRADWEGGVQDGEALQPGHRAGVERENLGLPKPFSLHLTAFSRQRVIFPKDGIVMTACYLNIPRVPFGNKRKPQLTGDIKGRCSQLPVTCALSAPSTPGLHGTGVLVLHSALSDPRAGAHAGPPSRTRSILPAFLIPLEVSPSLLHQTFSGPLP